MIKIKGLSKAFGNNTILKDLNLNIRTNEIIGIAGINGAGKTTLLKLLIGYESPQKGVVYYKGKDVLYNEKIVKKEFGFASQDNCFYDTLTVKDNLLYFGRLHNIPKKILNKRITDLLSLTHLESKAKAQAKNLSTGMKKRLDIACALIHDPLVLIADEPTKGLDPLLSKETMTLFQKLRDKGKTIIMSSHSLDELSKNCDNLIILHNQKIIEELNKEELRKGALEKVFCSVIGMSR